MEESFYAMKTFESIEVISLTYSTESHRGISRIGNSLSLSNQKWQGKLEPWGPDGPRVVK